MTKDKTLSGEVCLSYNNVSKTFGSFKALSDVTLDIRKGEIFGFIGPDGSGKTSLIRMAMGILNPDSGECALLGSGDRKKARVHAGYIPQRFGLYPDLTVIENALLFGSLYGTPQEETLAKSEEILTRTGLWSFKDRYAAKLSGGMKQKLALATGLLHTPQVLFLDEPTTGVDPVARREFWAMLYELNATDGLTIIVSTPYMDEAELCTRKAFFSNGRLLAAGTTEELLARYPYRVFNLEYNQIRTKPRLLACDGVIDANMFGSSYHIAVSDTDAASVSIEKLFTERGREYPGMTEIEPALEDLFVALSGEGAN